MLLSSGAILEARTVDGQTPLMRAAQYGNIPGMEFLLSRGAMDVRDTEGHYVLWYAERWDQKHGADDDVSLELWLRGWLREHRDRRPLECYESD